MNLAGWRVETWPSFAGELDREVGYVLGAGINKVLHKEPNQGGYKKSQSSYEHECLEVELRYVSRRVLRRGDDDRYEIEHETSSTPAKRSSQTDDRKNSQNDKNNPQTDKKKIMNSKS